MNKLILALLLLSAPLLGACGPEDTTRPLDAATDAPQDCRPAYQKLYEACGPHPQHWAGEDPATWIKEADIWMGCAGWVK